MTKRRKKRGDAPIEAVQERPETLWPGYLIAAGLALIVFVRPWRDGASFQGFNAYFVWLTMGLVAVWAARLLFRETTFRFPRLAIPLAAFIGVALVTSFDSYLPDYTFRQLIYWTTYFFLFVLAANTLRTPATRGIFYSAFVITMTCSAAWAIIHLQYVLPQVREMIELDPATRQYYFQTADLPAELAHRLSVNRAYGATLFPNALAALMILTLPFLVAEFAASILDWRRVSEQPIIERPKWKSSLAIGVATTVVLGVAARFLFPILYVAIMSDPNWQSAGELAPLILYALPLAVGMAVTTLLLVVGRERAWLYLQMIFLPFASIVVAVALYKTYSRGGMLALAMASTMVAALLIYRFKKLPPVSRVTATGLLFALAFYTVASHAQQPVLPSEGIETDVLSPESFLARLDYWRVGASMIADNPWTGVGLGAFGPAYANYMFPGAATSQMAHNHFIQAFAETGVFGFLSIVAFWVSFFVVTVRALITAPTLTAALRIAGPLGAVLAFLIHSCVDFNLSNPSLAMTSLVFAGACCARAATVRVPRVAPANVARYVAGGMLVVVAVVTSGMIRIYTVDYALTGPLPTARKLMLAGNRLEIRDKLYAARFYLEKLATHSANPQRVLYSGYEDLLRIVPDHYRIIEFAFLAQLDTTDGNRFIRLENQEELPPDAVVVITDVDKARHALIESARALLNDLESIDRPYPFIIEVSMHAYQWCDLVITHAPDPETERQFALLGEKWAARSVERSPHQSAAWLAYGKALWQRATTEPDNQVAQRYYDEGLNAYRRSAETFPASPNAWESYATALDKLGKGYIDGGHADKGDRMIAEAADVRQHVRALQQEWAVAQAQR